MDNALTKHMMKMAGAVSWKEEACFVEPQMSVMIKIKKESFARLISQTPLIVHKPTLLKIIFLLIELSPLMTLRTKWTTTLLGTLLFQVIESTVR